MDELAGDVEEIKRAVELDDKVQEGAEAEEQAKKKAEEEQAKKKAEEEQKKAEGDKKDSQGERGKEEPQFHAHCRPVQA
eukprot:3370984-Alexandrium_andersonii.AAC.2